SDPAITDVSRPWMDCMGDGIYLFGVTSTHRNGIGALEIAIHLVMTVHPVASPEQEGCQQRQIPDGHLSLPQLRVFATGWFAAAAGGTGALTSGAMMWP